jgi:hypothetical protein
MARYFDYEDGAHGLSIVVSATPLSSGCLVPGEVKYQIDKLKSDLDRLHKEMLKALPNAGVRPWKRTDVQSPKTVDEA